MNRPIAALIALTALALRGMGDDRAGTPAPPNTADPRPSAKVDLYGDPLPEGAIARMGAIQFRHKEPVVAFSDYGKTVIVIDSTGNVIRYDVATGKRIGQQQITWPKPKGSGSVVREFSPKGDLLAVGLDDVVVLYDVASGKELRRLSIKSASNARMIFSENGRVLAILERRDNTYAPIQIWDAATGNSRCSIESAKPVSIWSGAALSRDGKLFAIADYRNLQVQLWDAETGKKLSEHEVMNQHVEFAPDGKTLAVGGFRGVTLFEAPSLKELAQLALPSEESITSLKFSSDGSMLSGGRQHGDLVVWDVHARRVKFRLDAMHVDYQRLSPDGKTVAVWGFQNDVIGLWDLASGKQLHHRPRHGNFVRAIAVSRDGRMIASGAFWDPAVRLWDAASGKELREYHGADASVDSVAFSADDKFIAAGGDRGTIQLWELATGRERWRTSVKGVDGIDQLHLSPDGSRLTAIHRAFRQSDSGAMLRVWDTKSDRVVVERPIRAEVLVEKHADGGMSWSYRSHFGFASDRGLVSLRASGRLVIEDVRTGHEVSSVAGNIGSPLAFSPDGRLIAATQYESGKDIIRAGEPQAVVLMETATGQEVRRFGPGPFGAVSFSADGRFLLTGAKIMRVWDIVSAQEVHCLSATGDSFGWLAKLVQSDRAAVTGMTDGTLLVWDIEREKWSKRPMSGPLEPEEIKRCWNDLSGNAQAAFRAACSLSESPAECLAFLKTSMKPAPPPDAKEIEKLIANLDHEKFAIREAAANDLAQMRDKIDANLKRWLEKPISTEARRRIKAILAAPPPRLTGTSLRDYRAVGVLEAIGSPEAKALLSELAAGAPEARLTREANATLERMERRP